jgi:hypothetical protein
MSTLQSINRPGILSVSGFLLILLGFFLHQGLGYALGLIALVSACIRYCNPRGDELSNFQPHKSLRWLPWLAVSVYSILTILSAFYGGPWGPLLPVYLCFPAGFPIGLLASWVSSTIFLPKHGTPSLVQFARSNWALWIIFILLGNAWQYWLWRNIRKFLVEVREGRSA